MSHWQTPVTGNFSARIVATSVGGLLCQADAQVIWLAGENSKATGRPESKPSYAIQNSVVTQLPSKVSKTLDLGT